MIIRIPIMRPLDYYLYRFQDGTAECYPISQFTLEFVVQNYTAGWD